MDAIVEARHEELREEGVDFPPAEEDPLPPEVGTAEPREPVPEEPLYTVKIDGQERQVPLSELTAGYQTRGAADNRLGQANEVLRQARVYAEATANAPAPAGPAHNIDEASQVDWGDVAEKLQYGDKEEAAAALEEAVSQTGTAGNGAVATPEQIETRVLERVEWTTALSRFGGEYQDILKDHYVANVAGSIGRGLYNQAMQDSQMNGTPRPAYWDIFNAAGEKTREWLNGLGGQEAAGEARPAVNLSPERGSRKRAAVQPPTPRSGVSQGGASRKKAPRTEEQQRRDGIHEIQRARGQR